MLFYLRVFKKKLILLSDYLKLLLFMISNRDLLQQKMYTFCEVRTGTVVIKRQSFLISSHEDSEGMEFGASVLTLTFVATRTAELSALGTGHCVPPGKFLVHISVTAWVEPRISECGQKEQVPWKYPRSLPGIEPGTSCMCRSTSTDGVVKEKLLFRSLTPHIKVLYK